MHTKAIILFDGICNLCNGAVQFIIRRDPKAYYSFASLQSDYAQRILPKAEIQNEDMNSLLLIENGKTYRKSTAVLRISRHLSGGWKVCSIFLIIPRFIRDGLYDFIAGHRYKWFGKKAQCMTPKPEWIGQFL